MTRETKIGLLVGLAFIIMVGLLLTNQLSNNQPPARIAVVADNVRDSVTGMGGTRVENQPVTAPSVTPSQPVPTEDDLQHPAGRTILRIGPGNTGHLPAPTQQPQTPAQPVQIPQTPPSQGPGPVVILPPTGAQPSPVSGSGTATPAAPGSPEAALQQAAREHGEELVFTGRQPQPTGAHASTDAPTGMKQYQVQAGDSLSKIAAKFYGSDSPAARQAIIKANPSLAEHPDRIILGKTYNIPAALTATATADAPQHPTPTPAQQPEAAPAPEPAPVADADHFYLVKKGDTLWGIAQQQMGTPKAMAAIQDLNQDLLKGSTTVREGMKLRLPAKPLASAN